MNRYSDRYSRLRDCKVYTYTLRQYLAQLRNAKLQYRPNFVLIGKPYPTYDKPRPSTDSPWS